MESTPKNQTYTLIDLGPGADQHRAILQHFGKIQHQTCDNNKKNKKKKKKKNDCGLCFKKEVNTKN